MSNEINYSKIELINRISLDETCKDQKAKIFENVNAYSEPPKHFKNATFSYSIFRNCYFRNSKFTNCDFVGCKFYDSNFKGCEFIGCSFNYALFQNTILPSKEIIVNLPKEHNIRRELLQDLRANAISQCEYADEKLFILHEIEATKSYYKAAAKKEDSYYRKKYPGCLNSLKLNIKRFCLWLDGFTWGHGENLYKAFKFLFFSWLVIAVLSSVSIGRTICLANLIDNAVYVLYLLLYATPPDDLSITLNKFTLLLISILRFGALGLLISTLYRRMSHR